MKHNEEFCANCYQNYSDKNPKYEEYPLCCLCASKIAVAVLAETVATVMAAKGLKIEQGNGAL